MVTHESLKYFLTFMKSSYYHFLYFHGSCLNISDPMKLPIAC